MPRDAIGDAEEIEVERFARLRLATGMTDRVEFAENARMGSNFSLRSDSSSGT